MAEYSVWKPPTSSCSASTRSNGGRLSSAVAAMTNTTKGSRPVVTMFQSRIVSCSTTMPLVERVPATRSTVATDRPRAAS